jgi:hypothetical protein
MGQEVKTHAAPHKIRGRILRFSSNNIAAHGNSGGHLEVPLDFGFRRLGALGSSVGCAFCSLIFG